MNIQIALLLVISFSASAYAVPSFKEVKGQYKKSDAVLLDRHGVPIHELRVDPKGRRLDWVTISQMSPALITAVIRSEDRRFYEHSGVDWQALGATAITNLFFDRQRGASTITMQLAAIIEKNLRPKHGGRRSLSQKWEQIEAARALDGLWSKDQIIEAYLNLVSFRGELQGIASASRGIFDKEPAGLTEYESVILASLIRSPNASVEAVAGRACKLAESLGLSDSCPRITHVVNETLAKPYHVRGSAELAPHVAQRLLINATGAVRSTLDADLQRFVSESLARHLSDIHQQNVRDGAVLVIDNATGDILAYVANMGGGYVDGIQARRQAGSTLKPFLYGLGIERRLITAASILDDSPVSVTTEAGLYIPQDYESDYKGPVTIRNALSSSLNIPAVRTLMLVGPDEFVRRLESFGFTNLKDGEYYGLSMALGSVDVSLYELTNAYRSLANGGKWSKLKLRPEEKTARHRQVMDSDVAYIISDILSDRTARGLTFGYETTLATRFWSAVKTGTSKDMRDNWCIGFSDRYTVGVWVGNFSGSPMWNVSGLTGAAPVWLDTMQYLHSRSPAKAPAMPKGVISARIGVEGDPEPHRAEIFLKGTEPAMDLTVRSMPSASTGRTAILYPPDNAIMALDPDIPPEHQIIFFKAANADSSLWMLDGLVIATASAPFRWSPMSGRHVLALVGSTGEAVDTVKFEIRGMFDLSDREDKDDSLGY